MDIIQMSISASVLIIAVVIIRALALHKLPKMTFLVLWSVAVFRLFVPLSIPSRLSIYTGLDMLKSSFAEKISLPSMIGTTIIPNMENIPGAGQPVPVATLISPIEIIWLAGMCVCMLFFIVVYVTCVRQFKMSLPIENDFVALWLGENSLRRTVQIRQSGCITTPLTYGVFRPVVLFPMNTDWTDETKLRYVLAHEYTHIRRFDTLTKLVLTTAVCVHWFNPLVWVMYVLANRDIELSCDETVVRSFGKTIKSAYALTLIGLEEKKSRITPLVNNFGKNAIEERITAIMKMKKTSLAALFVAFLLIGSLITVFATSATSAELQTTNIAVAEDNDLKLTPYNPTKKELLAKYGEYGVDFNKNGKMIFNGELVRYFWDGVYLDTNHNESSVRYEYLDESGTIDVHTTRAIIDNGDGSINPFGNLMGVIAYSQAEFDKRDLTKKSTSPVTSVGNENSEQNSSGKTFTQIFEAYSKYGITYEEIFANGQIKRYLYLNGQKVGHFIDESEDGIFTFASTDGGEATVYTIYDGIGKLIGVEKR